MEYVVPHIPRIHTAVAEWTACGVFILIYSRQSRNPVHVFQGILVLILQCTIQIVVGMLPLSFWIPGMLFATAAMYFGIYHVTCLAAADAACLCVRAFVLAEFAASLEWQISCYAVYAKNGVQNIYWETVIMVIVYIIVFVFIYAVERRLVQGTGQMGVRPRELINPSGWLVDTYAYDITRSPAYYNAGDFSYSGSEHEEISGMAGRQTGAIRS